MVGDDGRDPGSSGAQRKRRRRRKRVKRERSEFERREIVSTVCSYLWREGLMVAGPCASCNEPKTEVVHAVLEQGRRLITHLAVDSRCGRELVS